MINRSFRSGKEGIALIAVIILITFVATAVAGVTVFIVQRGIGYNIQQISERCRYNAQAGLHYALYQFRQNGTNFSGTVTIDSSNSAVVSTTSGGGGGAAASLQIDATGSSFASSGRNLVGITLTNTSASSSITIAQMTIYLGSGSETLDDVIINGVTVWTTNTSIGTTPVTVNISNVTIPASTTIPLTRIRFTNSASSRTIFLQFIMSDSTTTSVCTVAPPPASVCTTPGGSLTIKSMGKVSGSNLYRSVQATYNTSTGNVSDYQEITTTVP